MIMKQYNINELLPADYNPRKELTPDDREYQKIKTSIETFGYVDPIIINKDKTIIGGHQRLNVLRDLGYTDIDVIEIDIDKTKEKALNVALNKISGEWDIDKLGLLLNELKTDNFDLDITGFDADELDGILFNVDELDDILGTKEIVEDELPEVPEEPKAKLGDIYQLGNHRLMCGDSTSVTDIDKLLNGNKIDMIYTDPPYGMDLDTDYSKMTYNEEWSKDRKCKSGKKYEQGIVDEFNPEMINTIMSLNVKETFLWGADYFAELLPNKNDGAWIVWDKRDENIGSFDKMFGSMFELCWSKNKHKREIARIRWCGCFGTEKEFDKKRYHPTQKPTELSRWFIDRYSKENNTILDLFGGSGSTLIACEQLNRKCYMMELDPKYIDVIIERWEQFTGKKAVLLNGEE